MGVNDDTDGKTTHLNCFGHRNDNWTKRPKTSRSVIVRLLNGGKA